MINSHKVMLIAAGLWLVSPNPAAATVATATLDWSNFQVFALGVPNQPEPTFSLSAQSTAWNTSATTVNDSSDTHTHSASNWTTALDIASNTPHANGDANASSTLFSTNSSASESNNENPQLLNQSTASLDRTANVDVSGPAAVIFSVPFSLSVDDPAFDFQHHTLASVTGNAVFTPTGEFSPTDNTQRSFALDSFNTGPASLNGTLFFGLVVDGAGTVSVDLSAATSASAPDPVPEPSIGLGLFAGLIALVAVAKRRTTKG